MLSALCANSLLHYYVHLAKVHWSLFCNSHEYFLSKSPTLQNKNEKMFLLSQHLELIPYFLFPCSLYNELKNKIKPIALYKHPMHIQV